jgi:recombination protein RecT
VLAQVLRALRELPLPPLITTTSRRIHMATAQLSELRAATPAARPLADMKPKEQISFLLNQKKGELAKMLPKTLSIERLLKVAQIAATTTPALAKCDMPSLVGAIGQCAQMGLEPNTVLGHAYLVPFNTKRKDANGQERWVNSVQVIIGYKGLIDLARRSGQIVSIAAHEVCENDHFELVYGLEEKLNHTPAMGERGPVKGFYAVAKLKDGGYSFEFMSTLQVQEIMRATQSKGAYGPWKEHFIEMGRKTAIRRLAKYLPLSIEFQSAVALDNQAEAGKDQKLDTIDGEFMLVQDEDAPRGEVDQDTGEIRGKLTQAAEVDLPAAPTVQAEGAGTPAPAFDQQAFAGRLRAAKDKATLDALGQEIQQIADEDARNELEEVFLSCLDTLSQAAAAPAPTSRRPARPAASME